MPRISELYGIVIYMYWFDNNRHKMPHIHAMFAGKSMAIALDGEILSGSIGRGGDKLVKEFVITRKKELKAAWELAITGKELPWIKPI